jgi:hypothetical protein
VLQRHRAANLLASAASRRHDGQFVVALVSAA